MIKLMNQNFSKSKILQVSSQFEHFQWGEVKNYCGGYKFKGIKILDLLKVLGFQ